MSPLGPIDNASRSTDAPTKTSSSNSRADIAAIVSADDRAWFAKNPGKPHRERRYVPFEFYPYEPAGHPAYVIASIVKPGVRARALVEVDPQLPRQQRRAHARSGQGLIVMSAYDIDAAPTLDAKTDTHPDRKRQ